ncbi:MAG: hsp70 family protein [Nitrospirae bacterium]|nr:hsp70 family protein [Nitrospirota bacterium]
MRTSRFIIGIDLGTTNSAVAFIDTSKNSSKIETFYIPQLIDTANVKGLHTLPSYLYLPTQYELKAEDYGLPWSKHGAVIFPPSSQSQGGRDDTANYVVGYLAREKGAKIPANLVSSAKSWLCHSRVQRRGPILPWGREVEDGKVSPVEASAMYLRHMKDAWNYAVSGGSDDNRLENQQIVLTIPASFDELARELTSEAAIMAGFKFFTMLEEPQAAFYWWIAAHQEDWPSLLGGGSSGQSQRRERLVLVFDIGGGTTDFNLIAVTHKNESPVFQRVAVGDHLLLGGDNMDLAIAKEMEGKLVAKGGRLDFNQWVSLSHQCRSAKEELLSVDDAHRKDSVELSILGTGRSVIAGAMKGHLTRDEAAKIIIDGFFKKVSLDQELVKGRTSGFQELGLPYVSDPVITKHLSLFLRRHAVNPQLPQVVDPQSGLKIVRPDVLLFNGGVFKSPLIRSTVIDTLNNWFTADEWSLQVLDNDRLDHAVALGAAYYGQVLRGVGLRITGGTGKAYYIAVESGATQGTKDQSMAAQETVDKSTPITTAITTVCVAPKGLEEGQELHIAQPEFQVLANNPVSFSLYCSSFRVGDKAGDIVIDEREAFVELPAIKTVLSFGKKTGVAKIPVSLFVRLNEYGTLDVYCESKNTTHRWKLAFQLRGFVEDTPTESHSAGSDTIITSTIDETIIEGAGNLIRRAFDSNDGEITPDNITKMLEQTLDLDRTLWPLYAIRNLWDVLIELKHRRVATPKYEARWLNLAGFLLRPGFGHPLDDFRVKELWKLFADGVKFARDGQCRSEWWILWRRVAGGLSEAHQDILFKRIAPYILHSRKRKEVTRLQGAELVELWMLAASLEHLSMQLKEELGNQLIGLIKKDKGNARYCWSLSRIGARQPFHGPVNMVVSRDMAEAWVRQILAIDWPKPHEFVNLITQLIRKTGDRLRDVDDSMRQEVIERIKVYDWAQRYIEQINNVVAIDWEEEKAVFGESLPIGLCIEG